MAGDCKYHKIRKKGTGKNQKMITDLLGATPNTRYKDYVGSFLRTSVSEF